jgi:subtilase family serine protease
MNKTFKIITVVLVAGVAASFAVLQVQNKELVQGQIFGDKEVEEVGTPDLVPFAESLGAAENGNLRVKITIQNNGTGPVFGDNPYSYGIYINDELILTNTDSYLQMNAGDSFTFVYPIDREVYAYEDSGVVKVVIDENNRIDELNEDNNVSEDAYTL